eukprot:4865213-Pleurochrysis_carterae.AAC.3
MVLYDMTASFFFLGMGTEWQRVGKGESVLVSPDDMNSDVKTLSAPAYLVILSTSCSEFSRSGNWRLSSTR